MLVKALYVFNTDKKNKPKMILKKNVIFMNSAVYGKTMEKVAKLRIIV